MKLQKKETVMCQVSVIIPVYGVEKWLPACLDSVLSQSLKELEILAIDDASPDGCGKILDDYAARDSRLKVFHLTENRQQGYGRNLGLANAAGRYVYLLDADDAIRPDALRELYEAAEEDRLDGIFFDSEPLYESAALARKYASYVAAFDGNCPEGVCSGRSLFHALSTQNQWTCYIQRQFWRRSFLEEQGLRFPEGTEHEDEYFSFCAVLSAGRMRYIHRPYFLRRYRPDSVMTRKADPRDFHGYFSIFHSLTDFVWRHRLQDDPGVRIQLGRLWDRCLRYYPVFAAQACPEKWFPEPEMLHRYRCFAAAQWRQEYDVCSVESLLPQLPREEELWIYGAGILGQRCFRGLSAAGFRVAGFLVSRHEGNPETLFGRAVLTPDEAVRPGCAVVALSRGYLEEVHSVLETAHWHYWDMP